MDMDLGKIALLARIKLQEDEKKKLLKDFENILAYVKKLNELDTQNVPPTSHVLEIKDVFRQDTAQPQTVTEEALKHAPSRDGNFFQVPKIIEGE